MKGFGQDGFEAVLNQPFPIIQHLIGLLASNRGLYTGKSAEMVLLGALT
jgi:hypothetical protein